MRTVFALLAGPLLVCAQQTAVPQTVVNQPGMPMPVFRVNVVARTTKAINYHHRSGPTMIDFRGTNLMPLGKGEAQVESKQGVIKIDATFEKLQPAISYGPEYTTYVLWAVTPEGRATNIGEIVLGGQKSKISATTDLQTFGLIVTAEPYYAVTFPSDVVILENQVRPDTSGTIQQIDAKYELIARGGYTVNAPPDEVRPEPADPRVPLELKEARNAVKIARWAGAMQYAPDTYKKALQELNNAEDYLKGKSGKKPIGTVAREAVQMAEDARIITVKKMDEEQLAKERADAADREAKAKAEKDAEAVRRAQAEADAAEQARHRVKAEADAAEQARIAREERAAADRAKEEALRAKAEADRARQEAQAAGDLAARQKAEAEAARQAALVQQQAAQAEIAKANAATAEANRLRVKAENEKEELRQQLLQQLNLILETRDTARGLIVNMSDVLFDSGSYTLKQPTREKLAKLSGIVLSHPGLVLEIEGHTDSIGGDDFNQKLSEHRAASVRDYLVQQGLPITAVSARGYGKTMPIAPNETSAGRAKNRRVEIVVSGEAIGTKLGGSVSSIRR